MSNNNHAPAAATQQAHACSTWQDQNPKAGHQNTRVSCGRIGVPPSVQSQACIERLNFVNHVCQASRPGWPSWPSSGPVEPIGQVDSNRANWFHDEKSSMLAQDVRVGDERSIMREKFHYELFSFLAFYMRGGAIWCKDFSLQCVLFLPSS